MFKTLDLSQILLTLNDLRTEFTTVSEDRKQACWLSQLRIDFVVDEAQGAENSLQACRTWNNKTGTSKVGAISKAQKAQSFLNMPRMYS